MSYKSIDSDCIRDQYVTQAVESAVLDVDGDVLGHVGLLDLDEVARAGAVAVAERLPGQVAILRSSPRSWHLWALTIDSLDSWQERADEVEAVDPEHIALNSRREVGVLRVDSKINVATGDVVKPEPRLVAIEESGPSYPRSAPHAELLIERFGADRSDLDVADPGYIGASVDFRTYMADIGGGDDGR